ncbi:MAG: hypothetical protein GON13_03750 [Nanoarchaeota archaeon]|nr:hypothetical protein [Nanoarchaeota archaeon]
MFQKDKELQELTNKLDIHIVGESHINFLIFLLNDFERNKIMLFLRRKEHKIVINKLKIYINSTQNWFSNHIERLKKENNNEPFFLFIEMYGNKKEVKEEIKKNYKINLNHLKSIVCLEDSNQAFWEKERSDIFGRENISKDVIKKINNNEIKKSKLSFFSRVLPNKNKKNIMSLLNENNQEHIDYIKREAHWIKIFKQEIINNKNYFLLRKRKVLVIIGRNHIKKGTFIKYLKKNFDSVKEYETPEIDLST